MELKTGQTYRISIFEGDLCEDVTLIRESATPGLWFGTAADGAYCVVGVDRLRRGALLTKPDDRGKVVQDQG